MRRRRRPQLDLAALDRLSETITRAVALIEERVSPATAPVATGRRGELVIRREGGEPEPELPERERPPEPPPEPEPQPEARPALAATAPSASGFVLFVPTLEGYRLATPDGVLPEPGERLSIEDVWYRVLRLGPSPLPGDARRCAFLEAHTATLD